MLWSITNIIVWFIILKICVCQNTTTVLPSTSLVNQTTFKPTPNSFNVTTVNPDAQICIEKLPNGTVITVECGTATAPPSCYAEDQDGNMFEIPCDNTTGPGSELCYEKMPDGTEVEVPCPGTELCYEKMPDGTEVEVPCDGNPDGKCYEELPDGSLIEIDCGVGPLPIPGGGANADMMAIVNCIKVTVFGACTITLDSWCNSLRKCNLSHLDCTCLGDMTSAAYSNQSLVCAAHQQLNKDTHSCKTTSILNCSISQTITRVKAGFNIACGIVGVFGNLLVVIIGVLNYEKSTRCHILITALALVDFIFSVFQLIHHIPLAYTCEWLYGYNMCKFLHPTLDVSYMIALGFILLIAVERYVGIVHPFSKWLTNTNLAILVGCNIMAGAAFVIPIGYYMKLTKYDNNLESCEEEWPSDRSALIYSWSQCIIYFILPISIIAYMYWRIVATLKKSKQTVIDERQQKKRSEDNKRIMKILASITIAFAVLVLPNRLTWLILDHYGKDKVPKTTHDALTIFGFIPYAFHTAINPIIYSLIDKKFRLRVIKMFRIPLGKSLSTSDTTKGHSSTSSLSSRKKHSVSQMTENGVELQKVTVGHTQSSVSSSDNLYTKSHS